MTRVIKTLGLVGLLAGLAPGAMGFSLLGPFKTWQVGVLGYQLPGDIGGPMLGSEGYRWNVHTIHYAFDQSFIAYFGKPGMAAIDDAVKIFNELPTLSSITNDGFSLYIRGEPVPTDVRGPQNFSFAEAGLFDLKSTAMRHMMEELGFAQPTRFTWTLRSRAVDGTVNPPITNYVVVKLNYDPITGAPSSYVNGQLYDYRIEEPIMLRGLTYVDAIEELNDPTAPYAFSAVADLASLPGTYFFALSHDDIGGLRFLYNKSNFVTEPLLPNITGSFISSSPWSPYVGTNVTSTNVIATNVVGNLIVTGVRPGNNKIRFKKVKFDSLVGQLFVPVTNSYTDTVITNSRVVRQSVQRGLTAPDLLFVAEDLGLADNLVPFHTARTSPAAWQNNDALNGNDSIVGDALGGPGVIVPPISILFSDQLPYWRNSQPNFIFGENDPPASAVWGSFDENTEVAVIYPLWMNLTLEDLQRLGQQ